MFQPIYYRNPPLSSTQKQLELIHNKTVPFSLLRDIAQDKNVCSTSKSGIANFIREDLRTVKLRTVFSWIMTPSTPLFQKDLIFPFCHKYGNSNFILSNKLHGKSPGILLNFNMKNMNNTVDRIVMVDVFGACCRTTGSDTVVGVGRFSLQTAQLFLLVKVRRRPGAALRIRKATERVFGTFCVLYGSKQVERLIGLDVDTTCYGGERGVMKNNSDKNNGRNTQWKNKCKYRHRI